MNERPLRFMVLLSPGCGVSCTSTLPQPDDADVATLEPVKARLASIDDKCIDCRYY